jgi:6-phosphogluconolactonase
LVGILLLSVGEDEHIASLFLKNVSLQECKRLVIPITGPKPPLERLTITPQVITKARSVFVLAAGFAKSAMLCVSLNNKNDIAALPARLALGGTWLMDTPLTENIF